MDEAVKKAQAKLDQISKSQKSAQKDMKIIEQKLKQMNKGLEDIYDWLNPVVSGTGKKKQRLFETREDDKLLLPKEKEDLLNQQMLMNAFFAFEEYSKSSNSQNTEAVEKIKMAEAEVESMRKELSDLGLELRGLRAAEPLWKQKIEKLVEQNYILENRNKKLEDENKELQSYVNNNSKQVKKAKKTTIAAYVAAGLAGFFLVTTLGHAIPMGISKRQNKEYEKFFNELISDYGIVRVEGKSDMEVVKMFVDSNAQDIKDINAYIKDQNVVFAESSVTANAVKDFVDGINKANDGKVTEERIKTYKAVIDRLEVLGITYKDCLDNKGVFSLDNLSNQVKPIAEKVVKLSVIEENIENILKEEFGKTLEDFAGEEDATSAAVNFINESHKAVLKAREKQIYDVTKLVYETSEITQTVKNEAGEYEVKRLSVDDFETVDDAIEYLATHINALDEEKQQLAESIEDASDALDGYRLDLERLDERIAALLGERNDLLSQLEQIRNNLEQGTTGGSTGGSNAPVGDTNNKDNVTNTDPDFTGDHDHGSSGEPVH